MLHSPPVQIRSDDIELYYETSGEGFPLVLLHPFPVHHGFWSSIFARLSPYRLIALDLRGHGLSGVGDSPATMAKHATDLLRLLDAENIGRAAFICVSLGGYIFFELWRRAQERVAAVVLANTRAEADTDAGIANRLKSATDVRERGTAPFLDAQILHLIGETTRRNRPDLVANARTMMQLMTPQGLAAVQLGMAERPNSVPVLANIKVPTLIVAGEEDTLTPLVHAQVMHGGIRNSQLVVIPKAGHYAAFEYPEEFSRVLRKFLDGLQLQ
jgi:3-oxoadipate enol-lactonase